jgi:hypothetical protein
MKEACGLSKLIEVQIVHANIQDRLIQQAVQNCKISRLRGRSQACQDEVPLTKSNLLGNLPQPGIFQQLRQEVLGEHSSVAKCSQRSRAASR